MRCVPVLVDGMGADSRGRGPGALTSRRDRGCTSGDAQPFSPFRNRVAADAAPGIVRWSAHGTTRVVYGDWFVNWSSIGTRNPAANAFVWLANPMPPISSPIHLVVMPLLRAEAVCVHQAVMALVGWRSRPNR